MLLYLALTTFVLTYKKLSLVYKHSPLDIQSQSVKVVQHKPLLSIYY